MGAKQAARSQQTESSLAAEGPWLCALLWLCIVPQDMTMPVGWWWLPGWQCASAQPGGASAESLRGGAVNPRWHLALAQPQRPKPASSTVLMLWIGVGEGTRWLVSLRAYTMGKCWCNTRGFTGSVLAISFFSFFCWVCMQSRSLWTVMIPLCACSL